MNGHFTDRSDAGARLARALPDDLHHEDVLVLALPRGGVPIGYAVAKALDAELDVLVVRKLGVPDFPELALGAIGSGDALYINDRIRSLYHVSAADLDRIIEKERAELRRREQSYRGTRPPPRIQGRTVVVVDDGMATGASMRAALLALRASKPARILVAVPVAPPNAGETLTGLADAFVSVLAPRDFSAVGQFYDHFDQTGDDEVRRLLARSQKEVAP
ncbi:MAG: phosphoribosyltransferase [Gammaproteobacteria bacterium]|nr:phosphoribosyltransferase [Gammaproteobacteria bacterium]